MKNIYIILSFITLLLLASCSSSSSNDMHSMDDWTNMQGTTHEESQNGEENMMPSETETQVNEKKPSQEAGTQVSEETSPQEIDEESIVWDGSMHSMDDGTNMQWATHEESENHIEWDTHGMDDGSEMQGSSHSEWM